MPNCKEYRSVSEFPSRPKQLTREALEAQYLDLRQEYTSLVRSRGQLVRRNNETKVKLQSLSDGLQQKTTALDRLNFQRQQLQDSLQTTVEARDRLQAWGDNVEKELNELKDDMRATTQFLSEFEEIYEETNKKEGIWSIGVRLSRLLYAAHRLLHSDIRDILSRSLSSQQSDDDWTKEDPASVNRALLEGK